LLTLLSSWLSTKLDDIRYFDTVFLRILLLPHCFYGLHRGRDFAPYFNGFSRLFAMGFRPPTQKERLRAIGSTEGLPSTIQRALVPGTDFNPISLPNSGDWLAEHYESGQTFKDFIRAGLNGAGKTHSPGNIRSGRRFGCCMTIQAPDLARVESALQRATQKTRKTV
jgi:hypothetical protein